MGPVHMVLLEELDRYTFSHHCMGVTLFNLVCYLLVGCLFIDLLLFLLGGVQAYS